MNYDLTVFLPSIKTHLLERWYHTLEQSCKRYKFQVSICSPFELPNSLSNRPNVVFTKDYGSPTRCGQLAALFAEGEVLYHVVDDGLFVENAIDSELDRFFSLEKECLYGMRYTEGLNYNGIVQPVSYWRACCNEYKDWPVTSIAPEWGQNCHFMMRRTAFIEFGGFETVAFEYLNHSCHDLQFRCQKAGYKWYDSLNTVLIGNWTPGFMGFKDHMPIMEGQSQHDSPTFREMWYNGNNRRDLDINNWTYAPEVWSRRFGESRPNSYEEMYG